ncbi:hypothetical protein FVER53590_05422 [Fusarium verticillioides]|nr:hypothetical protein FVER53590_05422 [Fusarium verticillioides]
MSYYLIRAGYDLQSLFPNKFTSVWVGGRPTRLAVRSCPVQYSVSPRVVIAHSQQTIVARRVRLLQRRHTQFLADLDLPRAQIAN